MALVPDASAIISLAFPDEDSAYALAVIEAIDSDQAFIPALFWFEVRNVLLVGERRGRITVAQTTAMLADLNLLPFEVDHAPREDAVLDLARRHTLTIYDAAYLELARRKNLPLATLDRPLAKAAQAIGVPVWERPLSA